MLLENRHSSRPSPAMGEGPSPLSPSSLAGECGGEPSLQPEDLYLHLIRASASDCDGFDAHIVACILAISFSEAASEGKPLASATGLPADELNALIAELFPKAGAWRFLSCGEVERSADEGCLFDLLAGCTTAGTPFETRLAALVARRAQRPNHLWQDLGLSSRRDLSELLALHFRPLAKRNTQDMKWKKFFYRAICADAAYALCTAPSCAECDDFEHCFGEETGEALLARTRRASEGNQQEIH